MGKTKRATRKELEDVIRGIIEEIQNIKTVLQALNNYCGYYMEWKGDKIAYESYLGERFNKTDRETNVSNVEGNVKKSDKKDRYRKISTPL